MNNTDKKDAEWMNIIQMQQMKCDSMQMASHFAKEENDNLKVKLNKLDKHVTHLYIAISALVICIAIILR